MSRVGPGQALARQRPLPRSTYVSPDCEDGLTLIFCLTRALFRRGLTRREMIICHDEGSIRLELSAEHRPSRPPLFYSLIILICGLSLGILKGSLNRSA